jgi:hypothetical protein
VDAWSGKSMGIVYQLKKREREKKEEKRKKERKKENNNKVHVWIWIENSSFSMHITFCNSTL